MGFNPRIANQHHVFVAERRLNRGHVRIQSSGVAPRRTVIPGARGLKPTPIHQISLREEGIGTVGRRFFDLPCLRFALFAICLVCDLPQSGI